MLRHVESGVVDAEGLAQICDVSLSTIRRDLARLSRDGALLRTYGGAAPIAKTLPEQPYAQRAGERAAQKRAIATLAAGLIEDGETILLDAGTTVGALATELRHRHALHVVTNSWTAMQVLADCPDITLTMLGGNWRSISMGFVGAHAERNLRRIGAARAFLGADGVVASHGICEMSYEQASLKELMISQATAIYVLVTAEKLGHAASHAWVPIERPWTLITDAEASPAQLEPFRRLGHVTIKTGERP